MPPPSRPLASARFPCAAAFFPLATAFTEQAAAGFALGPQERYGLVLGVEEVLAFYREQLAAASLLELSLEDQGHQLCLTLSLRLAQPDLRAFNLTYRVDPDDEDSLAGLGPLLAARGVTRLRLEFGSDDRLILGLIQERDYPIASPTPLPPRPERGEIQLLEPSREDIRHFAALVAGLGDPFLPPFLARPGMAADMLASQALGALLAQAGNGLVGGVLWRRLNDATLELFGPYRLYPDPEDALLTRLLDAAVARVARSGARMLLRRQDRLADPGRFFDFLGELSLTLPSGQVLPWPHYYRQLREESGGVVYAEPRFAAFLEAEYARLCLPRQVRVLGDPGGRRAGASLLGIEFETPRALAILRPLAAGADMADNLAAHLDLLAHEAIHNPLVEIDTAQGEATAFTPALYAQGFLPRLLLPDAGQGDLVLFSR